MLKPGPLVLPSGARTGHLAAGVEGDVEAHRRLVRRVERIDPVDQHFHGPAVLRNRRGRIRVRLVLDEELAHGVGVALAVIDAQRRGRVVGGGVGRIERRHGRRLQRRVKVVRLLDARGGLRRLVGALDLEVGDHAVLQLAVRPDGIALQAVAVVVDDEILLVGIEVAGAGVADRPVVAGDEEAVAVDGQVQHAVGRVDVALLEHLRDVREQHAAALRVAARTQHRGGVDVGELRAGLLEAYGAGVGDVVAGDVQAAGGRLDAAQADVETHG